MPLKLCEHGKQRYRCKDCGGSGICEHGRRRRLCKDCGGSGICEHGRQRNICKDCGGSGLCEHGREHRFYKDCGGSGICEHGRQHHGCIDCVSTEVDTKKGWICVVCHVTRTRVAVCSACTKAYGYKAQPREEQVSRALLAEILGHHFEYGKFLGGEACAKDVPEGKNGKAKRAYCDATLSDGKGKVALIEFDEHAHESYPAECELSRYHTLHHGCTTERKHTRCFRINTSSSL